MAKNFSGPPPLRMRSHGYAEFPDGPSRTESDCDMGFDLYDDEEDASTDGGLLSAIRNIGLSGEARTASNPPCKEEPLNGSTAPRNTVYCEPPSMAPRNYAQQHTRLVALQEKYKIDLNDEKNLVDLEDHGLIEHMKQARLDLSIYMESLPKIPCSKDLHEQDTAARRALSAIVTDLKSQQMAMQIACDDLLLQAINAQKLAKGGHPYGYPPSPPSQLGPGFDHLGLKMRGIGDELARIVDAFQNFECNLTLVRRLYEVVVDGWMRRGEHYEKVFNMAAGTTEGPS